MEFTGTQEKVPVEQETTAEAIVRKPESQNVLRKAEGDKEGRDPEQGWPAEKADSKATSH